MTEFTGLTLPGEDVDVIIDHLHDDVPSLKACALVCHSWLPSSRYHLFYKRTINDRRKAQDTPLFLSVNPALAAYIRHLDIKRGHSYFISFPELEALLRALPSIRVLSLKDVTLSGPQPAVNTHEEDAMPSRALVGPLEDLEIEASNIVYHDFALLFRLLALFAYITRVQLIGHAVGMAGDDAALAVTFPAKHTAVVHLRTREIPIRLVENMVCCSRTKKTLQTLWYESRAQDEAITRGLNTIFATPGVRDGLRRVVLGPAVLTSISKPVLLMLTVFWMTGS